jgi:hypothetical protein
MLKSKLEDEKSKEYIFTGKSIRELKDWIWTLPDDSDLWKIEGIVVAKPGSTETETV